MSLHVCPGESFIWLAVRPVLGKKLSFSLSAGSVLVVVPLLLVRSSFPSMSWTEGVR